VSLFYDAWIAAGNFSKNKALDMAADAWAVLARGEVSPSQKQQLQDELDGAMRNAGASVEERRNAQLELARLFNTQAVEGAARRSGFTLTTVALVLGIAVAVIVISSKLKQP